ncbi:glycoside hydrolase N-terminal domain-containing protein [Streptomyces sp. GbtcB7]|uniref:glycosyl hydrolase family 95 catalytic domain-containing protein n=1 Tax=Streptomyces sp. GbtcB7 TaxID=2824752 RepID=UPI001C2FAD26|nr:glycoside hydrolase N-terminal domain-containing protein [Streptomyces sp. GbtcB7]
MNRRQFLATATAAAATPAVWPTANARAVGSPRPPRWGVHDEAPATTWTDGFLSGNGETGITVYGAPASEKVVLNHHRLVLPNGTRDQQPPVTADLLENVRDLALAGNYRAAQSAFSPPGWTIKWTQTYHPSHQLVLESPHHVSYQDYLRTTDFRTGQITTSWSDSAGTWRRRAFVSRAHGIAVHELLPPRGATIDLTVRADPTLADVPGTVSFTTTSDVAAGEGWLTLRGTYPADLGAHGFEGVTRIIAQGGGVTAREGVVEITDASRVLLLSKLGRYDTADGWDSRPVHRALAVPRAGYDTLLAPHARVHRELYDRTTLDLGGTAADRALTTSRLIARQNADPSVPDPALLERLFAVGRYHFVSSSGVLPPRLTGIWSGGWKAAWAGDFTTDANVNLQVAAANLGDLAEPFQGYVDLVLGQIDDWRTNARRLYGARGFLAPSRTDGENGFMFHFHSAWPGHAWTGGADWLFLPLLEHYQVTRDERFLRRTLAPLLLELALFYEDFLTRTDTDGNAVFVPSFSMENVPANTGRYLAVNATGDVAAGRHALRSAIWAAKKLDVEQGAGEGAERWSKLLERIPPYRLTEDGLIAEWSWPGLDERHNHRHVSHLYGAWPLHEINPEDTPDLVEATRATLVARRADTSYAAHGSLHRALVAARVKDGPKVEENLARILGKNMLFRSLMTSHNPNLDIFNADASNAIPAVLVEALAYSRPGVTELLPALPDAWPKGTLRGIRGRDGVTVEELSWDLGKREVRAVLRTERARTTTLISRRGIGSIRADAVVRASELGTHARELALPARKKVHVRISLPG